MRDNKFFLTSVAKFLCRGRVDRGTGGGKVVVVGDWTKRKVVLCTIRIRTFGAPGQGQTLYVYQRSDDSSNLDVAYATSSG